ncbi:MAG: hypothetical protein ACI8PZ_002641 [Myxococcota bacterium]|jgi:hypothetical protein
MGTLRDRATGRVVLLAADCILGRASTSWLQIADRKVSGQHARLRWAGARWELRDLGSRNGTFVDETPLGPTETRALHEGARIAFGPDGPVWVVADIAPPQPIATHATTGERRGGQDGFLALPDERDPLLTVYQDHDGVWHLEGDGPAERLADRTRVEVAGAAWWVEVPTHLPPTIDAAHGVSLLDASLAFRVSADEEHVELTVTAPGFDRTLKPRVHLYMLLTLARVRLEEAARGDVPASEQGWVEREVLCRMLGVDAQRLKVDIFRARKQLAAAGITDAALLVERRATSRQLRLGVAALHVAPL